VTNQGVAGFPADSLGQRFLARGTSYPSGYLRTGGGYYYWCNSPSSQTASAPSNNTMRVSAWIVPNPVRITSIGVSVSIVGEAGSKVRLGIYADDGTGYPGALVLDAGQIAGDSATVQEIAINQQLVSGLYWVGAAVQSATTTQPTINCVAASPIVVSMISGTSAPTATQTLLGFSQGASSTLVPVWSSSVSTTGIVPRIFVKVA
jgi:hypothetical protein